MTTSNTNIRHDLQRLYELSLSIGNSLDPNSICHEFTQSLLRQYDIAYVSIWQTPIPAATEKNDLTLIYAFPQRRSNVSVVSSQHPGFNFTNNKDFVTYAQNHLPSTALPLEQDDENSHCAVFKLGSLGYMRLLRDDSPFESRELRQLRPLIEKLTIVLQGAFAHSQLNQEQAFIRSMLSCIPDAIFVKDLNGVYLNCNRRTAQVLGISESDIIGHTDFDLVPEDVALAFQANDRMAMESGQASSNQEWIPTNGRQALYETIKTPMLNQDGQTIGVLGVAREITALYEAEQSVRASEAQFKSYFDIGLIGMGLSDPNHCWVQVNQCFCDMLDYDKSDLLGQPITRHIHPEDLAQFNQLFAQLLSPQQSKLQTDIRFLRSDNKVVYTNHALRSQFNDQGKLIQLVHMVSDITDRHRSKQALKLAGSVFEQANDAILIRDKDQRIIDINQAFVELTGFSREEVIGTTNDFIESDERNPPANDIWSKIQKNGYWQGELWSQKKSGEKFAEQVSISAVYDETQEISHYVSILSDITALKRHQEELTQMAHFDALTLLPNRVLLSKKLQDLLHQSKHEQQQFAIVYLDLDNFKPINDQFGHSTGDQLLIRVAQRLTHILGNKESIARLGGDEFILLIERIASVENCTETLDKIIASFQHPFEIDGKAFQIFASLGVTLYPDDDSDSDTLIRHADQAMYTAKQFGRNRYHFFDPEQERETENLQKAQSEITNALLNKEFVLFYQPKVNMRTGKLLGMEALIRWQHPVLKLLAPANFLPHIKDPKLAIALDEWVIREALEQLRQWRAQGLDLTLSVNIVPENIQQADFTNRIDSLMSKFSDIPGDHLELEIIESTAIINLEASSRALGHCQKLGIKIALDDFGTGFSSLTYLRKIPFNTIKIDRSFVMDMLQDTEDRSIVEGIIGLSKAFQRNVIAEGVESAEHGKCLLELGCERGQGFGIAKPMPADEVTTWASQFCLKDQWANLQAIKKTARN